MKEIDSHIRMLQESQRESILWFSLKGNPFISCSFQTSAMAIDDQTIYIFHDILLITFGVLGNILILLTFGCKSVQKNSAIILVLALALGDTVSCLLASPLHIGVNAYASTIDFKNGSNIASPNENQMCQVAMGIIASSEYYTTLLHGLIAINRYYTVCRTPNRKMSEQLTLLLVLSCLAPSLVMGVFCAISSTFNNMYMTSTCGIVYHEEELSLVWGVSILATILLILILTIKIILYIRQRQRGVADLMVANEQRHPRFRVNILERPPTRHSKGSNFLNSFITEQSVGTSNITPSNGPIPLKSLSNAEDATSINHQKTAGQIRTARLNNVVSFQKRTLLRMTKALLLTITIFALSWLPAFVIVFQPKNTMQNLSDRNYSLFVFVVFIRSLPRLNHMINPVIYGFMSTRFQTEFKKMMNRWKLACGYL